VISFRRPLVLVFTVLLLVTGLVLGALVWALRSEAGSRQLMQWLISVGPAAGTELVVQRIEGNFLQGLRLQGVQFATADGRIELAVQRLEFVWEPAQLLQRSLSLGLLRVDGLRWRSRRDEASPGAPFDANVITGWFAALPLDADLAAADLRDLQVQIDDVSVQLPELRFAAMLDQQQLALRDLTILAWDTRVEGDLTLQQDLEMQGTLDWVRGVDAGWAGSLQVTGTLPELQLQHQLRAPLSLQSAGRVVTGLAAGTSLQLDLRHQLATLDFAAWGQPDLSVSAVEILTTGTPSNLAIDLSLQVQYQNFAPLALIAGAVYTPELLRLERAGVLSDELELDLRGEWDLAARTLNLQWELARLDRVFEGARLAAVQGSGSAALSLQADGVSGDLLVGPLQGQLNGHPLALDAELLLLDSTLQSLALDLRSADNQLQIQGALQPTLDLAWTLDVPALAQLHEALAGRVSGSGAVAGSVDAPLFTGRLAGSALAFTQADLHLALRELQLEATTAGADNALSLQINGLGLQRAGTSTTLIDTASARLNGSPAAHELSLQLNGLDTSLTLALSGTLQESIWQGGVAQAGIDSPFGAWMLEAPFGIGWEEAALRVDEHCWSGSRPSLCLSLQGSAVTGLGAQVAIRDLPLSWLNRGAAATGKPEALQDLQTTWGLDLPTGLAVQGSAALTANIAGLRTWPPAAVQAELSTRDLELQFTQAPDPDEELAGDAQHYAVTAEPLRLALADGVWRATADVAIAQMQEADAEGSEAAFQGTLGADVTLYVDARLGGILRLAFADLAFLETLVPDLQQPAGRLQGEATLAGTLSAPELDADVTVSEGAFILPALGIDVRDFGATLRSSNEALVLRASGVSGAGELVLQASMQRPFAADREFSARLEGSDFTLIDTPAAAATISPAVDLRFTGDMLELQGSVELPTASLNLESVVADVAEGGVDVSRDAVVLQSDPEALVAEQQRALPFNAGLDLKLGEGVRVSGFGLDVALNGELRLAQEAGRPLLAYGELGIPEGTYRIYNQELAVRDGRLLFYGNPLNPVLDVRAFRETRTAEVGMLISGTLGKIESRPYSTPTLPDNEILAMLVTGKSFNNMNDSDGNALLSAVAGFGIERGEGLTSMIGNRLGLDSVAINSGDTYLQSSLGLGKYITPDLLMRYEIGIFDRQAVLSIDYSLSERLKLEVRSGISQSVDISYTIEKD